MKRPARAVRPSVTMYSIFTKITSIQKPPFFTRKPRTCSEKTICVFGERITVMVSRWWTTQVWRHVSVTVGCRSLAHTHNLLEIQLYQVFWLKMWILRIRKNPIRNPLLYHGWLSASTMRVSDSDTGNFFYFPGFRVPHDFERSYLSKNSRTEVVRNISCGE